MDAIRATVDEHTPSTSIMTRSPACRSWCWAMRQAVRGLLERTDNLEKLAQELGAWRHDINTSIRMG